MDNRAALEREFAEKCGRYLLPADADRLEEVARQLGRPLQWAHIDINDYKYMPDKPGRAPKEDAL
jgi:hypothetical protein